MKIKISTVSFIVTAFLCGVAFNNVAISKACNSNVAVVDLQKVVSQSAQVKALKIQRSQNLQELSNFIANARKAVAAESDKNKKTKLEANYNKQLNEKKQTADKLYITNLNAIDKSISDIIAKKAKENNYDIVLSKGVVLYGGDDITQEVSKDVK